MLLTGIVLRRPSWTAAHHRGRARGLGGGILDAGQQRLDSLIYGYLNRVPSSRRLERECQRNIELFWLTGQLAPDFKTIADFRKDNGKAIREVCRAFVALCRELDLLSAARSMVPNSRLSMRATRTSLRPR